MRNSHLIKQFSVFIIIVLISISCSSLIPNSNPATGFRYDNLPDAGQNDKAVAEFRAISQWGKTNLTYYFINGTGKINGNTEQDLIRAAFALWATETPLTFKEVADSAQADILIGWAEGEHGDGDPFDGPGNVLAHASYPNPYEDKQVFLHFDDSERWVNSATQNVDLLTVAAHEIGHTLGLDHSSDRNALMYPSYSAPHRSLGQDDIVGIQSVYGLAAQPAQSPQIPPENASPEPSAKTDSDQDGISDQDEILRTGTNPNKADTDGDGLSDGVEVTYRMNPLDADMDKDGVNDGQEVAQGSDPFFPDQTAKVSPELSKEVGDFITKAIKLQIEAYRKGDAKIAASIMAGEIFNTLESDILSLNQQGFAQISEIDYYKSYINNIRVINDLKLEVDSCEVWSTNIYRRSDSSLIKSIDPRLLPQTITIQKLDKAWFITQVKFIDEPAFCK